MEMIREKEKNAFKSLKEKFGYVNVWETPRLEKVVVSTGVGSVKDKKKIELIADRLALITGQKPVPTRARQSIASFKLRIGDIAGYQVTLRGKRMRDFLDRLFTVCLPRTRDFKGIPVSAVDEMGNVTIGIREHTIFPETSDEELKDVFGLAITIVSSASNASEGVAFFEHMGVPFKRS